MAAVGTAQQQYLGTLAAASKSLSAAIEERAGICVEYGEIGLALEPSVKAHAMAASLGEDILMSDAAPAFGTGRYLAAVTRVPFDILDEEGNSDNTASLLQQLLFMQEGAIAMASGGHCSVNELQKAHDMLRGYMFEITTAHISAKMPGGRESWFMHKRNLTTAMLPLLPMIVASCQDADSMFATACSEQNADLQCSVLLEKLEQRVNNEIKGFSELVKKITH